MIWHIYIANMHKYYLEKNVAKYLNSKKYVSMKQIILTFEKNMLNWFFIWRPKTNEANEYIAITKKYKTDKIIQVRRKRRKSVFSNV